ncbi:trehalose-phosphatase [Pseudonocardia zijingensis]|uniref:Trehalose 6-phosphate phosphatase n=1 Tax=Pseudonocardia zijingensis TaxID=153376 RepID=A0ABP4A3E5_9PSEU
MTDLQAAVRALARARHLLVALDFDGVLAPIVPVPSDARPLPESAAAIQELAALPGTSVALLSGRGRADLATVSGLGSPIRLIGSHGSEFDDGAALLDDEQRARLEKLAAELRELVDGEPGVTLEPKPTGVAVHVRNAPPDVGARVLDAVRAGPAAREGIEVTPGKAVLDLSVARMDKGAALELLREQVGADAVLFAGDDVTDETAFARLRPGDVGVKVGPGDTAAEHRVDAPPDITALLQQLVEARRA